MKKKKLLWHSNAPFVGTGYGQQTAEFVPRIQALGWDVAISAFYGVQGGMSVWRGPDGHDYPIYPAGQHPYGGDVIGMHARHWGADLVISLMDLWALPEELPGMQDMKFAAWMPVDCDPLSVLDETRLRSTKAIPVAMTRFGQGLLLEAGFNPLYVPHGVNSDVFRPPENRAELRKAMGVEDRFVIVMNSANKDGARKGWFEQMTAFARFDAKHPEAKALLVGHTLAVGGLDLPAMADRMGIGPKVKWSAQYLTAAGHIRPEMLRGTYGMADLFSGCAMAEGFGIPIVEAMMCGTPVVVTDISAMPEVAGAQYKVRFEKQWAIGHMASWGKPLIGDIVKVYEQAWKRGPVYQERRNRARIDAMSYDSAKVMEQHWEPVLAKLEAM